MSTIARLAARAEDAVNAALVRLLRRRGYTPRVVAYPSYGTVARARVRARVLLTAPGAPTPGSVERRGWRNLLSAELPGARVHVHGPAAPSAAGSDPGAGAEVLGPELLSVVTDRGGYVDVEVDVAQQPGWATLWLTVDGDPAAVPAPVQVVDPAATHGIVSDIDDTVLVTMVPRPHVAAWNFLVRAERRRRPVAGMPGLYRELTARHPDAPVFYLSTGAWNTAGALARFLDRVGLPRGALLLTDLGPTGTALMRSGREHKAATLRRLADELPGLRWILVGDDGQHDPQVYQAFARDRPGRVEAIAVRELSVPEQVAASGLPAVTPATRRAVDQIDGSAVVLAHAPDGRALADQLRAAGVI
jgi:phosphatidate phosphatase APP1